MLDESQQQRASFNVVLVTGSPRAPWLWRLLWDDLAAPDAVLVGQVASVCSEGLVLSSGRVIDYDALICTSDDAGAPAVTDSLATSVCSYLDALQLDAFATESATPLAFPAEWSRRGQHGLEVEPGSFRVKATPHVFAMGACADTPARGLWPTDPVVQTQAIASGVLASLLAE